MLSLDLFATQFERELREGAVDDLEYRRMNDLREKMEMLMQAYKKADTDEVKTAIMKRYKEYKAEREGYMKVREQQVPSKQDPFAYVKPEPKGIGDIQDPKQKMAQLAQRSKKGPLANVGAGLKAFIKGEPEPLGEQELGRRGIGVRNMKSLEATIRQGLAKAVFQFPKVRPMATDEEDSDKLADYYNGLDSAGRTNFVYNVLGDPMKFVTLCKSLNIQLIPMGAIQPDLPGIPSQGEIQLEEKKSQKKKFKSALAQRELEKAMAAEPTAGDPIEAFILKSIENDQAQSQQLQDLETQLQAIKTSQGPAPTVDIQKPAVTATPIAAPGKAPEIKPTAAPVAPQMPSELPVPTTEPAPAPADLPKKDQKILARVKSIEKRLKDRVDAYQDARAQQDKATLQQQIDALQAQAKQQASKLSSSGRLALGQDDFYDIEANLIREPVNEPIVVQTQGAAESRIKEHGGGIGPKKHWQDLMQEGQPQELIHRYLAIDAENDVDAVRAAIQAISKDPALSVTSKSRLLGQIGMIIRRHRLPLGRAYYQFMQQYMEEQDVEEVKRPAPRTRGEFVPPPNSSDSYKAGHDLGVKLAHATNMTQAAKTQMVQTQMQQQAIPADFFKGYKKGFSDVAAYIRNQQDANRIRQFAKFKSITPDQVQQIVARYSAGETSPQIASDFGLDAQQILRLIDKQSNRDEIVQLNRQNRKGKIGPQRQLAFDGKQIKEQGVMETALNPKDPKDDYEAKRRALHDLSLNKGVDQQAVLQRRLDLDREAKAKDLAETVTNVKAGMAEIYRRLAPKIERHRDSFLAGQLYDELENYAELHGAEGEFKRMMATARNSAHMEYDTNPGGFQNWFWFLPFEDDDMTEGYKQNVAAGILGAGMALGAVPSQAQIGEIPSAQIQQSAKLFELSEKYMEILIQRAKEDGRSLDYVTMHALHAKARAMAAAQIRKQSGAQPQTPQQSNFPEQDSERMINPAFNKFEDKGEAEGTDDVKKRMSKLEALALAANRAGDDAKCKMYQQKIQSLKQKLSQSMAEGWSDQGNPTAYSVYIDGREWRAYKSDDHARAVAEKVRANLKKQGREQTVTIAPSKTKRVQEDFGMPGATIPRKSVIQGYTVFFNPKTQVVSVTRGGDSEEAAIEQARVGTPSMKNFRQAADRLIDRIESDLNEGREIQTREDFIKERDRLLRMIGIETDPANKQILKSAIRQLENRAENEGWITIQSRMVREDSDGGEAVEMAIMRRMLVAHTDLIIEFGLDKVVQAIEEVAYNVGDTDEIGSSDVSGWVNQVKQILGADA